MNNCLCGLFDNNCTWIIILALIILFCCNNSGSTYGGCGGC